MQSLDTAVFQDETAQQLLRCRRHCRKSGQDAHEPEVDYPSRTRRPKRDQSGPEQESVVVIHLEFDNRLVLMRPPRQQTNRLPAVSSPKPGPDCIADRCRRGTFDGFLPGEAEGIPHKTAASFPDVPGFHYAQPLDRTTLGSLRSIFFNSRQPDQPVKRARFTPPRCSRRITGSFETKAWTTQCAFHVFA